MAPSDGRSLLLELPAKLRNCIYQFALVEHDKVIPYTGEVSNQLRLVCRQLYDETNWFELGCNTSMTFIRDDLEHPGPAEQFLSFARVVPVKALRWLRTVVLVDRVSRPKGDNIELPLLKIH